MDSSSDSGAKAPEAAPHTIPTAGSDDDKAASASASDSNTHTQPDSGTGNSTGNGRATSASESGDYSYEDDFEDPDSSSKAQDSSSTLSPTTTTHTTTTLSSDDSKKAHAESSDLTSSTLTQSSQGDSSDRDRQTNGQSGESGEDSRRPAYDDPSDDSEPEPEDDGSYMFTDDQHRAMMELVAQKHDQGDYSDDPPEYNVKERLKELNAELAKEPDPAEADRAHRVGFKEDLVDLVAPPPDLSDDDSPRKTPAPGDTDPGAGKPRGDGKGTFVVERDGKFDVVAAGDLTASERAMFNIGDEAVEEGGGDGAPSSKDANNSNARAGSGKENASPAAPHQQPSPPSKPRPSTAGSVSRRPVRPSPAPSPRPHTATATRSPPLDNFDYRSPYAMSPEEKDRAAQRARARDQHQRDQENRKKQEEEYNRQESDEAFQAWLRTKRDEDRRRRQQDNQRTDDRQRDRSDDSESKENEEAFRGWLKTKQAQQQREKLLKKRENQELKDGYYVRSREECDRAYKEWLKQKYAELRRQRAAERLRVKAFRSQARRSRKQQMMARALRQSQAFRYVDYYGYRF